MRQQRELRIQWRHVLPLAALAVALVTAIFGSSAFAGVPATGTNGGYGPARDFVTNKLGVTPPNAGAPLIRDAYMELGPGGPGTCPAPPNGGTTQVGCTFILDMILHTGSNQPPAGASAQQSYLTFTHQLIKNANVAQVGTGCVLTSTVTADMTVFNAVLQNETCNGPNPCLFRGVNHQPGWMAYASGALPSCSGGCGGNFRVARIGLCATAPGQAVLHWQFTPPDPITRDSEIVAINSQLIHDPDLYADYVINIQGQGGTPTRTNTPVRTPTRTATHAPYTPTRTFTPNRTPPPQCDRCNLRVLAVTSSCHPISQTVHWVSVVHNPNLCPVQGSWRAELQVREHGSWRAVRIQYATFNFPPGDGVIQGDFCYRFSEDTDEVRVEFLFEDPQDNGSAKVRERTAPPNSYSTTPDSGIPAGGGHECNDHRASEPIEPCHRTQSCAPPPPPPTPQPTAAPPLRNR
jgi:hypothetical protein